MRYLCAIWVAECKRSYRIVQDPPLLEIFRMLYSRVEVPHPTTISRDVREIFGMARANIAKQLQVSTSNHFIVDYDLMDRYCARHILDDYTSA